MKTYDLILQAINDVNQWLLHTTNPEVDTPETSLEADLSSILYIILSSGHEASVTSNLIYQLEDLKSKTTLNNRAPFFIIVTDLFESSQQLAVKIIENLWKEYRILDVLVLVPVRSHDLKTEKRRNDVTSVFNVYTWFPFHSSGNAVVLIDEFYVDAKARPSRNSNLFPNKIPRKFQNHNTLSVMTSELIPVTFLVKNGTHIDYEGAEINLFKLILECLNFSYEYKVHDPDSEPSYALLMELVSGNFDMMFASAPLGGRVLEWGEPSVAYYETGYKWYVPCPAPVPRLEKISEIFSPSVWMSLMASFAVVTTVMWLLGKRTNVTEIKDYRTVSSCVYNAWATAMGVSASQPSTAGMRSIFVLWVCYSYSISTVFQTYFTSFLVNPGFGKQIGNFEDLVSSGLEYGYNMDLYEMFFEGTLEDAGNNRHFSPSNCNDTDTCLLRVVNDRDFATLQVEFMAKYFETIYLPKEGLLCTLQDTFRVVDIVMYFPKGSHFRVPINGVIRRILESGLMKKFDGDMKELWKIQKESHAVRDFHVKDSSVEEFFVFDVSHLQIAFWSLALGHGLGFVCLLVEIMSCTGCYEVN